MAEEREKNKNYNFKKAKDPYTQHPPHPMGQGDFANMPPKAKFLKFKRKRDYRDGIINSLSCDVEEVSEIYENRREE